MTRLKVAWCVSWNNVDRRELFSAVAGNSKWRDDMLAHTAAADPPDAIDTSIYAADIAELCEILFATQHISRDWGSILLLECLPAGEQKIIASVVITAATERRVNSGGGGKSMAVAALINMANELSAAMRLLRVPPA